MTYSFSTMEKRILKKARKISFPFEVTGYLMSPVVIDSIAFGRVYGHIKADPVTGRFSDGHLIHTSELADYVIYRGYVVLITRNSVYVCCVSSIIDGMLLMNCLNSLPRPTCH